MYVKEHFCSTCIVLTQLCEEGHASCTLKTSFVRMTLSTQLGKDNTRTTKEVFNVHDA
jgi:hypothetical protein